MISLCTADVVFILTDTAVKIFSKVATYYTLRGCLYSLDWTTGLTFELTFEFFFLSMINIAVVLLAKVNLGVLGK